MYLFIYWEICFTVVMSAINSLGTVNSIGAVNSGFSVIFPAVVNSVLSCFGVLQGFPLLPS
jgi:hypothetical protein